MESGSRTFRRENQFKNVNVVQLMAARVGRRVISRTFLATRFRGVRTALTSFRFGQRTESTQLARIDLFRARRAFVKISFAICFAKSRREM
jgi:hypothetical protein